MYFLIDFLTRGYQAIALLEYICEFGTKKDPSQGTEVAVVKPLDIMQEALIQSIYSIYNFNHFDNMVSWYTGNEVKTQTGTRKL